MVTECIAAYVTGGFPLHCSSTFGTADMHDNLSSCAFDGLQVGAASSEGSSVAVWLSGSQEG